ncbi:MAG TPA: alpha/beta fold hydrolase [Solirubrobacteraceae bacterium]|nr:alpha/beta fold hydrolase [Solirubrobacteraceae bacterium]
MAPEIRYARNGDVTIAWSATEPRPIDFVMVLGTVSHIEIMREDPGMADFLERIASFARVINLDRRGLGLSDRVEGPIALADEVGDVEAVLDAAGSRRAVVFGYTSGGPVALALAAARPERVQALVLYAAMAAVNPGDELGFGLGAAQRLELFERMAAHWGTGADAAVVAPSRADDPALRAWLGRMERASLSRGAVRRYAEQVAGQDARGVLGSLRVPALILHRTRDRMFDVGHSRYLARQIPGARFVELPGEDHLPSGGDQVVLLGEVEEFLTGGRRAAIARELLTVMFTDVADATAHAARLGDARWRELLAGHHAAVRRELERFGGREVKTVGDGFLATFAGPPSGAVRCAQAVLAALAPLGLHVRAGLHTGECEVVGDDVGGMAVHIAARVAALAAPGEVLVSGTTYGTVAGSGVAFVDRGARELRGVPGRWPLFAVVDGLRSR